MELNDENLKKLVDEIVNQKEISIIDIPGIDLYMDQVTTFFDDRLSYLKREDEDKVLTKTMINNYTKAKILMPAKNKKYTKNHMILLILIYHLKQVLSIGDINTLLTPLLKGMEGSDGKKNSLEDLYTNFLELKLVEEENFQRNFSQQIELIKGKSFEDGNREEYMHMVLTVLTLISQANIQKRMAEKVIDNFIKSMYQK